MRHKLFWPLVISTLIALYLCPVRPAQTQPQQCNLQLCTFGTDGCYKVTFQNIWKTPGANSASGINIYPKIEIDGSSVLDCSSQSISNRTDLIVNLPLSSGSYSLKLTLTAKLQASGIIVAQTAHTENFSTDTHQCPTCQIPMGQDGLSLSGCPALCSNPVSYTHLDVYKRQAQRTEVVISMSRSARPWCSKPWPMKARMSHSGAGLSLIHI